VDEHGDGIAGVSVSAIGGGRDTTVQSGEFAIEFPESRIGTQITLQVSKRDWRVFNPKSLVVTILRDPVQNPVKIVIAPNLAGGATAAALRIQIENPKQIRQTVSKQPALRGKTIYCDAMDISLIFAHAETVRTPVRIISVAVHGEPFSDGATLKPGACEIDLLSGRPYGIDKVDSFVITANESGLRAKYIKDASRAFVVDSQNILQSAEETRGITLKQGEEPVAFDVLLETKADTPRRIWFSVDYDADGPKHLETDSILLWR
jgi:hypothetical protein